MLTVFRILFASRRSLTAILLGLGLLASTMQVSVTLAQDSAANSAQDQPGDEPPALSLRDSVLSSPIPVHPDTIPNWEMEKHFGRAAAEIIAVNGIVWFYDRYIRSGGGAGFRIGFNSWAENLKNGFEWDDNNFATNQYAHPYHGSLYFNAARSNGYSFWESIPFTFAGSYMWEFFGETHHPSINDWIATSVGGTFMGESLWRLSSMVLDNTATGSERTWREIGGFALSPVRGLNRILSGETFSVHANPEDRHPNGGDARILAGLRTVSDDKIWDSDTTRVFIEAKFDYGDPFDVKVKKPFDHFSLDAQLNFGEKTALGWVRGRGILLKKIVKKDERSEHILAGYQHFDYIENNAYEFGGQSVGAAYLSRFTAANNFKVDTQIHANAILLGAVSSDYESFSGREYDYGPGVSFKLSGSVGKRHWKYVEFEHEQFWISSMNGNSADHWVSMTQVSINIPLERAYGVGLDYLLYLSEAHYRDFEDTSGRSPQFRLFLVWNM